MLEVDELIKDFGQHRALDGVSLTVQKGEIVGLLGPNGAGKTTLMNVIAGYMFPTSGRVCIDGIDTVTDPLKACASVGYLPERPPLYEDMTVACYLEFVAALKIAEQSVRAAELRRILFQLELEPVKSRLISNLSKGYQQRVGLGQAIMGRPPLLILDEPTAGLDPRQIRSFRSLLQEFKQDHAILFSSHILTEVDAVSDRVVILHRGRIQSKPVTTPTKHCYLVMTDEESKAVYKALRRIPGVIDVVGYQNKEGFFAYEVVVNLSDGDMHSVRRRIFYAVAKNDRAVLELRPRYSELEEQFFYAVANDDEGDGDL
ncbi:MAG TPA: ABC transporter ATP-binding protein [Clostridiaceae bacterium]|nr:ABC transporter ATP-binding protein [Clostridiaceae bacterium]